VGKINQLKDAVNHGVAERDQRINTAQDKAIDELLRKYVHTVVRYQKGEAGSVFI
jgi:hypothetical protein